MIYQSDFDFNQIQLRYTHTVEVLIMYNVGADPFLMHYEIYVLSE
jgi:hypothetical protein